MHCTAADAYGELVAARMSAGRPVGVLDGQIAAIARARRATVATTCRISMAAGSR